MSKKRILTEEEKQKIQEAKKELNEYIYNKRLIDEKIEDIKERKALLEKTTIELSNLPHGSKKVQDTQSESLAEVMDLTKDLEVYIKELKEKTILIEQKIDKLEQPLKNILYFKYIKGYNFTEVSGEINKEYDYTRKLHNIAIYKYAGVLYGKFDREKYKYERK